MKPQRQARYCMETDWAHRRPADLIPHVPDRPVNPFATALDRGQLYVELYCPVDEDHQEPHDRDECYVVVEGSGEFVCGDERVTVGPGDFLFVPAGMPHRFENFGHRLRTWVMFYGPEGGERVT